NATGDSVAEAMEQLREWRHLTRRMPAGAAIDRILEQSGLLVAAAASSMGGGEAGKLVYAQDRIRAACEAGMTFGDAVESLEQRRRMMNLIPPCSSRAAEMWSD